MTKRALATACGSLFAVCCIFAKVVEITGKVTQARAGSATVLLEGASLPQRGDAATIFFKLPGGDDEVIVGTGQVDSVSGDSATIKLNDPSVSPQKDQLARITSENPTSKAAPPAAPPTSTGISPGSAPRGALIFSHDFNNPASVAKPLFGPNVMQLKHVAGAARLTGTSPGILPALFGKPVPPNFIAEVELRAESMPPGARYGLIFRSDDVRNGGIAAYYLLMLDVGSNVVGFSCWNRTAWGASEDEALPAGTLSVGRTTRLTLEAIGSDFTVFVDGKFVAKFTDETLAAGQLGLCLAGSSSETCVAAFDNLRVYAASPARSGVPTGTP